MLKGPVKAFKSMPQCDDERIEQGLVGRYNDELIDGVGTSSELESQRGRFREVVRRLSSVRWGDAVQICRQSDKRIVATSFPAGKRIDGTAAPGGAAWVCLQVKSGRAASVLEGPNRKPPFAFWEDDRAEVIAAFSNLQHFERAWVWGTQICLLVHRPGAM